MLLRVFINKPRESAKRGLVWAGAGMSNIAARRLAMRAPVY